ncbi:MAG: adenosine kinase [Candidatus Kapabacteria bacterium]|nr:adenosine kinase [Ignavibacteriota bacterium]MCW5884558.1 adenosine kinase [Candidatus Kapabacteria bacterium]
MKDIELCGLGNGLVDLQFLVSDEDLIKSDLQKGAMVLIDVEKRNRLVKDFSHLEFHKVSGGSAANTIISFAQLGGKGAYKTVLGNDDFGDFYAREFHDLGIVLNAEHIETAPTGICVIFITPDSERTLYTCLAATAEFSSKNIDEDIITRSQWLYIEGYKFSEPHSTEAIYKAVEIAKKHDTKIAVTFSDTFVTELFRDGLMKVVEASDLVFCNEGEAKSFTKSDSREESFKILCDMVPNVAVTYGSEGSKIKWDGKIYDIPSFKVKPIDTTGAGDSYAGAFMYGIIKHGDAAIAGKLASNISSRIVAQMGPRAKFDMQNALIEILSDLK